MVCKRFQLVKRIQFGAVCNREKEMRFQFSKERKGNEICVGCQKSKKMKGETCVCKREKQEKRKC